jgi:tetratricopeptide (TPR) repeat protein
MEDSYKKAIETYIEMLQYYPDDEEGNIYLGAIYRNLEEWDLASERFNKIFDFNPSIACENIVLFHMAKGLYDKALEFVKANQDNYLSKALFHLDLGLIYLFQKRHDLALVEIRTASSLDPDYLMTSQMMGHIYQLQNKFQEAETHYRQPLAEDDQVSKFYGRFWLAHLYLARGQFENCRKEINQGISESRKHNLKPATMSLLMSSAYLSLLTRDLDKALEAVEEAQEIASEIKGVKEKIWTINLRGLIQLQMNKVNEAKDTAEELKNLIERTGFQKLIRYYYHLRGMIDRNENMNIQAIENFKRAISLLPYQYDVYDEHAFFLYPLALSYYQREDMDPAQKQFENIIGLATGRLMWGDLYAKSYYRLGKIFQHKGWTGKAIENYEEFFRVWMRADPDIPELEDAKKQVLLLKQGSRE